MLDYGYNHVLSYMNLVSEERKLKKTMLFNYDRENHKEYLKNLVKEGTYQDYENAIYEMTKLCKKIKAKNIECSQFIDQVDNVCYGDIFFPMPQGANLTTLYFGASEIINLLHELGVNCDNSCIYFNTTLFGYMYTVVAIKADDAPDLYKQGTRNFIVR